MYGCGGICKKFNDEICMGACSMDVPARKEFVKKQVALQKASGFMPSEHGALGTNKVLKPLNPNAHAMFDTPKVSSMRHEAIPKDPVKRDVVTPLSQADASELRRFRL